VAAVSQRLTPNMALSYFKRFRMEIDLRGRDFSAIRIPRDCYFVPWTAALLEVHAKTKYLSFCDEIDSDVFPCLADYPGCVRLMREIVHKTGFLPEATWLVAKKGENGQGVCCGTVQGVIDKSGYGSIQNLGIIPQFRGYGLGTALMQRALIGFQQRGLRRAVLEVTAQNSGAVRLYKRLGFYRAKTVYKTVEVAYA
jgi:ribosomal protein S18 acetylase RimI-like enzyme